MSKPEPSAPPVAPPSIDDPPPPSIDDPPRRRRLAWEHELYESHGFVEKFTNFVPDLWGRGGWRRVAAVVVFPLWALAAVFACGFAFSAVVLVAVLAAAAVGVAGYLVYAVIALVVGLLG